MLEDLYTKAGFPPDKIADAGLSEGMFRCSVSYSRVFKVVRLKILCMCSHNSLQTYMALARSHTVSMNRIQLIPNVRTTAQITTYYLKEQGKYAYPERDRPKLLLLLIQDWVSITEKHRIVIYFARSSNGTTTFHPLTQAQRALADEIISYFIAFAATGNPNDVRPSPEAQAALTNASVASGRISPTWPAHNSGKRLVFRAVGGGTGLSKGIKGGSYVEELDKAELERCKVWDSLADIMQI